MNYLMLAICLLLVLSGCNSGSGNEDNTEKPTDNTSTPPNNDTQSTTLTSIQNNIFTPHCASCHGGSSPAAGQDLSSLDASIANLINVDSSNPLFKRVLPGNAAESYLYLKISGDERAGARMPLGQPALSAGQINSVKTWIDDGAVVPDEAQSSFVITYVAIAPLESLDSASVELRFYFNKPYADHRQFKEHITLVGFLELGSHVEQITINSDQYVLSFDKPNSFSLQLISLPRTIQKVQIRLNDERIADVMSASGQRLDGDNDGIDGGRFIYDYHR